MTSILSAFPFIGEQSFATPGAFNSPLSIISANIAAINADVGAISGVTISPPSGNTIQMPSDLSISGFLSVGAGQSIGTVGPATAQPVGLTINVNSGISDYIHFNDTSNLRSDYLLGSHAGGTADGLNIYDVSGGTMIVGFSKQSVRFWQQVIAPIFDTGGALVNVKAYGALGDGTTNDQAAVQSAIENWLSVSTQQATLLFPAGRYILNSAITINFASNNVQAKLVTGYGATLVSNFSGGYLSNVSRNQDVVARNLSFEGLTLEELSGSSISGLMRVSGGTADGYIYRVHLRNCAFESPKNLGFHGTGNFFESDIITCSIEASSNTSGACIRLENVGTGQISSFDIYGGSYLGGRYGLHVPSPTGSVRVHGGTYLLANEYGILFENALDCALFGVHLENCWQGGITSATWSDAVATTQAGAFLAGRGYAYGCYGTASNDKMRYVIRCNAVNTAFVSGGGVTGSPSHYLRAEGAANSKIVTIGLMAGTVGQVHNNLPATGKLFSLGAEGEADHFTAWLSTNTVYSLTSGGASIATNGTALSPAFSFQSETSLGWYRSTASRMALSYGYLALGSNSTVSFRDFTLGQAASDSYLRLVDGGGDTRLAYGTSDAANYYDLKNIATAVHKFRSASGALELFRVYSRGSVDLATSRLLSFKTLATSALTVSAGNTNVQATEVVFAIGGTSGASLAIHSGGTIYIFDSTSSAKAT